MRMTSRRKRIFQRGNIYGSLDWEKLKFANNLYNIPAYPSSSASDEAGNTKWFSVEKKTIWRGVKGIRMYFKRSQLLLLLHGWVIDWRFSPKNYALVKSSTVMFARFSTAVLTSTFSEVNADLPNRRFMGLFLRLVDWTEGIWSQVSSVDTDLADGSRVNVIYMNKNFGS